MTANNPQAMTHFVGYQPDHPYHQQGGIFNGALGDHLHFTALNSDGTIIATGGYRAYNPFSGDDNNDLRGYVRVWKYENSTWSQMGQVLWGPDKDSEFGSAIDMSDDGLTMVVGAPRFDETSYYDTFYQSTHRRRRGRVQVYTYDNGTSQWVTKGDAFSGTNIEGKDYSSDGLGADVSISSDGNTIALGAKQTIGGASYPASEPDTFNGYVVVYEWNAGTSTWVQQGLTIFGKDKGDAFGFKVELSPDASFVVVSSELVRGAQADNGDVKIYNRDNNSEWQLTQTIEPLVQGSNNRWFGQSLSLSSGDGSTLAIGHPYGTQSVSIYTRSGNTWTFVTNIDESATDTAVADGRFGYDVALNGNGNALGVVSRAASSYVRYYELESGDWGVVGDRHDSIWGSGGNTINISKDGSTIVVGAAAWHDLSLPSGTGGTWYGRITVFDSSVFTNVATHWPSGYLPSNGLSGYSNDGSSSGSNGGVIGDPIVIPVSGPIYALPCDNHVYRYLSDNNGEVTVNVRHELSTNVTVQEIDAYCNRHPQAQKYANALKATKNVPPYAFPRYVYIRIGHNHVTFDLRTLFAIRPTNHEMSIHTAITRDAIVQNRTVNDAFKITKRIECSNGIECNHDGFDVYDNEVGKRVDIATETNTYGMLTVHLFSFENEQLRSGISISTERPITTSNSSGAIVAPMLAKDCRLKKLHSERKISNTGRKPKPCNMTFITASGNKTVMAM